MKVRQIISLINCCIIKNAEVMESIVMTMFVAALHQRMEMAHQLEKDDNNGLLMIAG